MAAPWTDARWRKFTRAYRREMQTPEARHLIAMLAALSHQTNLSVGCYCENAERCHRDLLRELLVAAGAQIITD
jgi:uncharacterized protein YeaO (DUF488 family)